MTRVAIVSGAASATGKALVRRLLTQGDRVFALDIDESSLRSVLAFSSPDNIAVHQLDVRDPEAWHKTVARAVERFGHVDLLCQVPAPLRAGSVHQSSAEDVARHVDSNVKGLVYGVQAVLPFFREQRSGHVVNVVSLAGVAPAPHAPLHAMTQFAVRGYSLSIAGELRGLGIFVTVVLPHASVSAERIARAIAKRAVRRRPLEMTLPWWRGVLARLGAPQVVPR